MSRPLKERANLAILIVRFAARRHFIPRDSRRPTSSGLDDVLRKEGFTNIGSTAAGTG